MSDDFDSSGRTDRERSWLERVVPLGPWRDLSGRVEQLEAEVAELRHLNLRLAELTDVVQELLVPLAKSDPDRVEEILERYRDELGT